MANLTIRNLDQAIKEDLRLSAARNGHSMEEEARQRLQYGAHDTTIKAQTSTRLPIKPTLNNKTIVLIIGAGIAAYKSLDLIRRLRERGADVHIVMTEAAKHFITPLAASTLAGRPVSNDLFDMNGEHDVGHIRLARMADLIVVAPATADRMAKIAYGIGDDLAGAVLLARKTPLLIAPAMNPAMWSNPATQRNVKLLHQDGVYFIGPEQGEMAEKNEAGLGRMSEPLTIVAAIEHLLNKQPAPLRGKKIIVTSGPTHEPIDPVRYIANRSSGKQGHAIASALANLGADVTLVSGPVTIKDPENLRVIHVETAQQMYDAVHQNLPSDAAIMVAAVADWRVKNRQDIKIKKQAGTQPEPLQIAENPDILASVGKSDQRPNLVIGFAAETNDLLSNAQSKLQKKGADWILANDVSYNADGTSIMGGDSNHIHLVSKHGIEDWPEMDKKQVAEKLATRIVDYFSA